MSRTSRRAGPTCAWHPDADVMECRADDCAFQYICLADQPHHIDDPPRVEPKVHDPARQLRLFMRALDRWFSKNTELPSGPRFRCPDCGHGMFSRWRSAGDSVKLGCYGCGLETDVPRPRGTAWPGPERKKARP